MTGEIVELRVVRTPAGRPVVGVLEQQAPNQFVLYVWVPWEAGERPLRSRLGRRYFETPEEAAAALREFADRCRPPGRRAG
jgi:hypothetical protein